VSMADLFQLTVQRSPIRPNFAWVTGHCLFDCLGDSALIMKTLGPKKRTPPAELLAQCALLRPLSGVLVTWGGLGSYPDFS
jgi:hypothetical protein